VKTKTRKKPKYFLESTHNVSWYPHSVGTKKERIAQFTDKRHASLFLALLKGKK